MMTDRGNQGSFSQPCDSPTVQHCMWSLRTLGKSHQWANSKQFLSLNTCSHFFVKLGQHHYKCIAATAQIRGEWLKDSCGIPKCYISTSINCASQKKGRSKKREIRPEGMKVIFLCVKVFCVLKCMCNVTITVNIFLLSIFSAFKSAQTSTLKNYSTLF